MSISPSVRDELALWLALAVAGTFAFYTAREHLYAVKEAARVTKPESSPDVIGQHTEDAISVDTLGELYNSPSWDIRQAATRIISERVIRDNNLDLLYHNAKSKHPSTRDKALASIRFLCTSAPTSAAQEALITPRTFRLMIDTLTSFLPQNNTRPHTPHTDWKLRTNPERDALAVLQGYVRLQTRDVLSAGLVTRWLAHYPFGGTQPTDSTTSTISRSDRDTQKRSVVALLKKGHTDDDALGEILSALDYDPEGRRQLRRAGLIGSSIEEATSGWVVSEMSAHELGAMEPPPTLGPPPLEVDFGGVREPRPRRRTGRGEESEEEVALRRRRRQAMVIGERGEEIGRGNIYERTD